MPGASSQSPALGLLLTLAIGLAPPPAQARVAAPSPPPDTNAAPPPAPISPEAAAVTREAPPPETPTLGKPIKDPPKPSTSGQPALVAPPNNVSPVAPTAGMGGRLMSADDPEARRAEAELEGTALTKDAAPEVPARLPPLQRGAWWSMFGAFALASAGGVFAGLAEVQEDKAERLAITLDTATGSQLRYTDVQGEYEDVLKVGRRDAALARGFLAVGGGFLVAGIVLFAVHAARARKSRSQTQLRAAAGGLEVRF